MTQLLIVGSTILAQGPFEMDEESVIASDAIYPKHVIAGWSMVDVEVPADFTVAGYEWVDGALAKKPPVVVPPVVPQSVTRFQGLAALDQDGKLDAVEALMADPSTPKIFKLAYQNALNFERGSQTVATMAAALGWSDEYVDQLFIAASGIAA